MGWDIKEVSPSPWAIGEVPLHPSGHKLKCSLGQVAEVVQVACRESAKLAHTTQAREAWEDQPTPLPWADPVSVLPGLPCFLDNFYVKSPDL